MGLAGQAGYLLGIDAGQTFTKAVLFTVDGQETAAASTSVPTMPPRPSWQERDMDLTWERTASAIRRCLDSAGVNGSQILAVGLSGHGDGLYLVDAAGKPVRPAILATDARAFAEAKRLGEGPLGEKALAVTGQVPAPYSHQRSLPGCKAMNRKHWTAPDGCCTAKTGCGCASRAK
jgi:L-xylulokinase